MNTSIFQFIPSRNRTCNLRIRSPLLYPIELWGRNSIQEYSIPKNQILSRRIVRQKIDNKEITLFLAAFPIIYTRNVLKYSSIFLKKRNRP